MKTNLDWGNVSDTLLIPLYCRAKETRQKNPIVSDPKAVEIMDRLKPLLSGSDRPIHKIISKEKYNPKLVVSMALRTRYFDRQVKLFAEKYPDCTIINLGCGFDSRFLRVDNGKMIWFDLDLPEVIQLKKGYFDETDRYTMLGCSVLDEVWIEKVLPHINGKVMILAEGLFMYLDETKAKELIGRLRTNFPGSELVVEMARKYWVNKMNSAYLKWKFTHQLGFGEDAIFRFGIDSAFNIEILGNGIRLIEEWSYFDDHEKRLGWFNLLGRFDQIRKVQWTLHFKLGETN